MYLRNIEFLLIGTHTHTHTRNVHRYLRNFSPRVNGSRISNGKFLKRRKYRKKCSEGRLKFQREWQLAEQRRIQRPCHFIPLFNRMFNIYPRRFKIKSRNFSLHSVIPLSYCFRNNLVVQRTKVWKHASHARMHESMLRMEFHSNNVLFFRKYRGKGA